MSQKKIKQARRLEQQVQSEKKGGGKIAVTSITIIALLAGGYFLLFMDKNKTKEEATVIKEETLKGGSAVTIETEKGNITVQLDQENAPKTSQNFLNLVEEGFYNGLLFHRVEPNFVIQGGDPKGDGTGGSGTNIPLEIKCKDGEIMEGETVTCPVELEHTDGALAMARSGDPNSASSQFYITNGAQHFLDGNYAVFGYVTEGLDVVRNIEKGDTMTNVYITPYE